MAVEQHGAGAAVQRTSEHERGPLAHEVKQMRTHDENVELLTVVHDEPAVPEEPQMPTPLWDEMMGDVLPPDPTHAAQVKELCLHKKLGVFGESSAQKKTTHWNAMVWSQ